MIVKIILAYNSLKHLPVREIKQGPKIAGNIKRARAESYD